MNNRSEVEAITQSNLRQLLLKGNIFQNPNKQQLLNIIHYIQIGNKKLYKKYINATLDILNKNQSQVSKQIKLIMYDHITQLAITANPQLIYDLNNDVFSKFPPQIYDSDNEFKQYIAMWKNMYNGKKDREDFPNVNKTLQKIITQPSIKLSTKLSKYYSQFNFNVAKLGQKKVQFFEDFEDSSIAQSFEDESRISQIVYMDIMQLKAIRQKIQTQQLGEQNCSQYLIKMKTFLNLRPNGLNNDLLIQFNKQKVWARHFIDHHQQYIKRGQNISNQSLNNMDKTNQVMISLSKDQQSIDQGRKFTKNKNNFVLSPTIKDQKGESTHFKSQNNEQNFLNLNKRGQLQSQIKNFTINEVPLDQSKFTQRSSKVLPVFNNSIQNGNVQNNKNQYGYNGINQNSDYYQKLKMIPGKDYKQMLFNPKQIRQKTVKNVPISRPQPQDTLPLDQSTINHNYSIPQQIVNTPLIKNTPTKVNNTFGYQGNIYNNNTNNYNKNVKSMNNVGQNTPQYQKILDGSLTNNKINFSSSNNPFANSKTNYHQPNVIDSSNNPYNRSPYEQYKLSMKDSRYQQIDVQNNPIRNRMTQDDLDSQNMDDGIIIKNLGYQNSRSVQMYTQGKRNVKYGENNANNLGYPQTLNNFHKNKGQQNYYTNSRSQQQLMTQQLSPRSNTRYNKSSKKRLSQLTSQKKMRKNQASKESVLHSPQQYVYKPYSIHFIRNEQGYNNFRRNCLQDKFTIYASSQLVIQCVLKKINQSKLQISMRYQNQLRRDLQMKVLYKIPKCFKIQKVSKIHSKFKLKNVQNHVFNLNIVQFPLQMCFLDLSHWDELSQMGIQNLSVPLPITLKNFIQVLVSSKQQWLSLYQRLNNRSNAGSRGMLSNNSIPAFIITKTFELNRNVIQPSQVDFILTRQFINVGAIQGYSVQQYGCICYYRNLNNLMFLIRISIRIDHIVTIQILSEGETQQNERDFMKYYMELIITLMGKYAVNAN